MTLVEDEQKTGPGPTSAPDAGSLMDRLRAERARIAKRRTTTFPVPGYKDPQLVPEFRLLTGDEMRAIGVKVRSQYEDEQDQVVNGLLDTVLTACQRILIREPGASELVVLDPDDRGPMVFDERLAEFLGIEIVEGPVGGARQTLLGVFDGNTTAAFAYGQRLAEWMQNTSIRLDEEAGLGEA